MAQPTSHRAMRHISRADSIAADTPAATPERALLEKQDLEQLHIPPHYLLPPTYPSPFKGTLEASLDALLEFGAKYTSSISIMDVLRKPVCTKTNWYNLLVATLNLEEKKVVGSSRLLLEEILFLATRTLLPEQIAQNRACMYKMYDSRKTTSMRMSLRYDMLREWTKRGNNHFIVVESRPPLRILGASVSQDDELHPGRKLLLPNVWATLIQAPPQGYHSHKVKEAMRHHVTGIDKWLMFEDEEVGGWSANVLFQMTMQVLLQWQWLRDNTERMEGMEVRNWEDLEGPANECEWVRDDKKAKA
ncbi:uncharacterized protein N0V89_000244 [Didymosphaeria variabile]|uniref:Uncharacterized protein n=1 Tax=Didymosphaeria variabile TaxID=1932322 RepID=A0A9W9CER5_9PLEO|nr:uncharacterized protein N0V89_000244 [Didymosphaeria variabile]KAJ4359688.1 hypothetical protein N0V89_000244 [Didymosphaeria variabile]